MPALNCYVFTAGLESAPGLTCSCTLPVCGLGRSVQKRYMSRMGADKKASLFACRYAGCAAWCRVCPGSAWPDSIRRLQHRLHAGSCRRLVVTQHALLLAKRDVQQANRCWVLVGSSGARCWDGPSCLSVDGVELCTHTNLHSRSRCNPNPLQ